MYYRPRPRLSNCHSNRTLCCGEFILLGKRIYEQNWDIELPDKMKVKLDIKDGNSSHNDGVRYTVFEVKERSEFSMIFHQKISCV